MAPISAVVTWESSMTVRAARALAILALTGACAGRSQTGTPEAAPESATLRIPAFEFPAVDSATLNALSAHLERLAQDSSLVSSLSPSHPRFYALFRDLEAAQREFQIALVTPDATGQTLYDRLAAMTARADSVFRALKERERRVPRP